MDKLKSDKRKDLKMDKNKVSNFKWFSSKRICKKWKSLKSNILMMELIISLLLAIMILTVLKLILV
jgi:hypothetical protein